METTTADIAAFDAASLPPSEPTVLSEGVKSGFDGASERFLAALGTDVSGEAILSDVETEADPNARPRNPDGTFAAKPVEGEAVAETPADGEPVAEETPAEPETPVEVVALLDRNGQEKSIEVSDPEIAEILRANKNDGMRRDEFNRRLEAVQKRERDFREVEALLAQPTALAAQMHPDAQVMMLDYLLATNLDRPEVRTRLEEWYANDIARREALLGMKEKISESQRAVKVQIAESERIASVQRTIEAQIPETASPEDAQDFYTAAAAHLGAVESQRGTRLTPEEVPPLLERFRTRFGFTSPAPTAAPPSLVPVTTAPAAPASAKADAIAKRATATAQRMKALPTQQALAAKVAPQSAGAAPAVRPRPKDFNQAGSNFIARMKQAQASGQ